jgi:hypothetical protein
MKKPKMNADDLASRQKAERNPILEAGKMTIHFMQEKIIWQN